jgi:hypothetical protein
MKTNAARTVRLEQRDVFDTRPTLDREGGRDVAMDDHSVRRIPATWRWDYLGATFTSFGVSTAMIYLLSGALSAALDRRAARYGRDARMRRLQEAVSSIGLRTLPIPRKSMDLLVVLHGRGTLSDDVRH